MADPNLKSSPIFGVQYPKENVDPWWTYWDTNFIDSLEAALLFFEPASCLVDYTAAAFNLVGDTLNWSEFTIHAPSGGLITVPAGSIGSFADGWALIMTFESGWERPLVTNRTASGYSATGTPPFMQSNNQIPVVRRIGANLIALRADAQTVF